MPRSNAYGRDTAPVTVNYSGFIAPRLLDAGRRAPIESADAKPTVGFTLPWAGAAAPAPAVRRRENLRSASFRDHPLAREASVNAALRCRGRGDPGPGDGQGSIKPLAGAARDNGARP